MKKLFLLAAVFLTAGRAPAQSNAPVRLAVIADSPGAATAADLLTAGLSRNPKFQLLERNEIDKVFREQAMSAGNRDYLKLGRILGTDGIFLLAIDRTKSETNLNTRLIAVKPGVILTGGNAA